MTRQLPAPGTPVPRTERLVLAGIARGRATSEIATDLYISPVTVQTYMRRTAARLSCRPGRVALVTAGYATGVLRSLPPETRPQRLLGTRQMAVLQGIAEGLTNPQIAQWQHVTLSTTVAYTATILAELEASDRAHAVALAFQHGYLTITEQGLIGQGAA